MRGIVESRSWTRVRARSATGPAGLLGAATIAAAALFAAACEITEITIAAPEDVIVAEVHVILALDPDGDGVALESFAYLHRTQNRFEEDEVSGARVQISGASGEVVLLAEQDSGAACLDPPFLDGDTIPEVRFDVGSCYRAQVSPSPFSPGEQLELEVTIPDGRVLTAVSRVPGAFSFVGLTHEDGRCRLEPDTNYRFMWTPSEGTWSYVADARIEGLPEALADRDIEAPDSLYLLGLSIGRDDTEIVFPRQFGFFGFFEEDDRDLIRALQDGLPEGAWAAIALVAIDRNWTNWVRGGNFNPSGQVRIPSVFGDGTGFLGTAVQRRVRVTSGEDGDGRPPLCGPAEPPEADLAGRLTPP